MLYTLYLFPPRPSTSVLKATKTKVAINFYPPVHVHNYLSQHLYRFNNTLVALSDHVCLLIFALSHLCGENRMNFLFHCF